MIYQINVEQMKCRGCTVLISLTLEEDFQDITSNLETKTITFKSIHDLDWVKNTLDKLFLQFKGTEHNYEYSQLKEVK